jgi:enoyl-CoA hydratase/carnithine racemase
MPVSLSVDSHAVAHVTLNRPSKRNALDAAMLASLRERVAEVRERPDVRVLVLRGEGGTFCAGADIADWVTPTHDVATGLSELGQAVFAELATLPVVSVAVIEGTAIGGGLELALACDMRIATEDALLGFPELGLGNLPSWGGTARLVDIAGLGVARHMLLSGELVTGSRAAELLMLSSAHSAATLPTATEQTVTRLLAAEPFAVGLAKKLLTTFEHTLPSESLIAGYTAGLESSRKRKQHFLDRKAAVRAARNDALGESPRDLSVNSSEGTAT